MKFTRITPDPDLRQFIECYWMMQSDDAEPRIEKIIPDGFTELIFNYGDLYQAKMNGEWHLQSANLLAGQLRSYFYLQNTGVTASVAVKLKPAALTQLYGIQMDQYLDKIVDLDTFPHPDLSRLKEVFLPFDTEDRLKQLMDNYFLNLAQRAASNPIKPALDLIFESNGIVSVAELRLAVECSERQLERLFKKFIGLSPKYYARIIRFNYIFQLLNSGTTSWADLVYQSGYYDQSHFIRNFKAFTGEDPSAYYFEEQNMANFFLNK